VISIDILWVPYLDVSYYRKDSPLNGEESVTKPELRKRDYRKRIDETPNGGKANFAPPLLAAHLYKICFDKPLPIALLTCFALLHEPVEVIRNKLGFYHSHLEMFKRHNAH
jgi:hypothetical protein